MNRLFCIVIFFWIFSSDAEFVKKPDRTWSVSVTSRLTRSEDVWVNLSDDWYVHMLRRHETTNAPNENYISLGGQKFYVYSTMKNDCHYDGRELSVKFEDFNNDGWQDLIISGIVNYTGIVDFEIYEQESVFFLYECDREKQRFTLKYKKASFDIEVENDAQIQWLKRYNEDFYCEKYRELDAEKVSGERILQHLWHYCNDSTWTKSRVKEALGDQ